VRRLVVIVIVGLLTTASVATAEPLAILRGIVVTQHGEARAYLEDPRTGTLRVYAAGDTVADGRIEAIHEDRVVLRRGNELVQLLMGPLASAQEDGARTARSGPTIGSGQPWLDRLGIPAGVLSRAIEQAPTPQDRNDPDD
jgi:hypothetical protein